MLKYRKNSSCVMSIKILMTAFFLPTNPASNIHIFRLTHIASFIKSDKSFVLSTKIVTWPDMCRLKKEETTQCEHGLSHQ